MRFLETNDLAWLMIQFPDRKIDFLLGDRAEIAVLWKVLAKQPVGVLINNRGWTTIIL